jgi:hypothetical protein
MLNFSLQHPELTHGWAKRRRWQRARADDRLFMKHRAPDRVSDHSKASFVLTLITQGYPSCCSVRQLARKIQRYHHGEQGERCRIRTHLAVAYTARHLGIFSEPMAESASFRHDKTRHVNQTRISDHGNCQQKNYDWVHHGQEAGTEETM